MKLSFSLTPISSTSAAADFLDADKHVNLGKLKTAGNKLTAAATKFAKALEKQDPVAVKISVKVGAKTARQIQKLTEPTTLYYVKKGTKPVPFSITKQKSGDTTYMRKRAVRIMSRKKATDAYDLVAAVYQEAVLDTVSRGIQRDLIKALEMHGVTSEKTKVAATGINQQRNDDESKAFAANMEALLGLLGEKVKPTSVFNYAPARGKPATYLTLPNKGVLVLRYADAAQLRAIKKKAADDAAKAASTSSVSESAPAGLAPRRQPSEKELNKKYGTMPMPDRPLNKKAQARVDARNAVKPKLEASMQKAKAEIKTLREQATQIRKKMAAAKGKEAKSKVRSELIKVEGKIKSVQTKQDAAVRAALSKHPSMTGLSKYTFKLSVTKASENARKTAASSRRTSRSSDANLGIAFDHDLDGVVISSSGAVVASLYGDDYAEFNGLIDSYSSADNVRYETAVANAASDMVQKLAGKA